MSELPVVASSFSWMRNWFRKQLFYGGNVINFTYLHLSRTGWRSPLICSKVFGITGKQGMLVVQVYTNHTCNNWYILVMLHDVFFFLVLFCWQWFLLLGSFLSRLLLFCLWHFLSITNNHKVNLYNPYLKRLSVLMLCASSNCRWPFLYHTKMAAFKYVWCFAHFLVKKLG